MNRIYLRLNPIQWSRIELNEWKSVHQNGIGLGKNIEGRAWMFPSDILLLVTGQKSSHSILCMRHIGWIMLKPSTE